MLFRSIDLSLEDPSLGQKRVSDTLRQRANFISAAGVRCVCLRHNLETFSKRLKVLEAHVAQTGAVLTKSQLYAMERAKEEKVAQVVSSVIVEISVDSWFLS